MTGTCQFCHRPTETVRGSENRLSRPEPREGYRVGYIREMAGASYLLCLPCLRYSLPSNVTA